MGFVVAFVFVLLSLSCLKGRGEGSIARLHKYETIVFTHAHLYEFTFVCVWISI